MTPPATPDAPRHPLIDDPRLRRRLIARARRWLGGAFEAEDLVQDTYLRSVGALLPDDAAGREAWLGTVLRHLCIDRLRRAARFEALWPLLAGAAVTTAPAADRALEDAQRLDAVLHRLVERLAPADAAALLLCEVFEFGHAELAALAGRSEAASRQQLHRALRRLRAEAGGTRPLPRPLPRPVSRHASRRTAGQEADELASDLLLLCRQALVQRDPAGLVALLQSTRPMARASAPAGVPAPHTPEARWPTPHPACGRLSSRVVQAGGQLALQLGLGDTLLCLLPLGPLAEVATADVD